MNLISVGLELLLAGLLGAALYVGVKLERRLKVLRESHADFAKAVSELNEAVARASWVRSARAVCASRVAVFSSARPWSARATASFSSLTALSDL